MESPTKTDNPMGPNLKIEERVARLEVMIEEHEETIRELRDDLRRMKEKIEKMEHTLTIHSTYFKLISFLAGASFIQLVALLVRLFL